MIRADIKDVKSGATYQGTTYDQWVTVQLPNGVELETFDSTVPVAQESDIGQERSALLVIQAKEDGIIKNEQPSITHSGEDTKICGEILDVNVNNSYNFSEGYEELVKIKADSGCMLVNPTSETASLIEKKEVQIGDMLVITPYRVDLIDIKRQ